MKKIVLAAALLVAGSLGLQDISGAHGGTYRGPGDTVPPGGGGGGGGVGGAGPSIPTGTSGPGPSTGGPAGPLTGGPTTGGSAGPTTAQPLTGGAATAGPELTRWSFWWEFNKDPYLNLRSHIHHGGVVTGGDDFFLGQGERSQARDSLRPSEKQIREKVVPALLRTLENETNNDIVTGAMVALAKIGDARTESGESEFERVIKGFLSDGNQEIAETAALSLGILANDASVPLLKSLLLDDDVGRKAVKSVEVPYRSRAFAAYGLSLIGNRTASEDVRRDVVTTLAEVLESDSSSTFDIRVACMIALGLVPLETIETASPPEDGSPAPVDASRLAQIDFVWRYFQDDDNDFMVRAHGPQSLVRLLDGLPEPHYSRLKEQLGSDFIDRIDRRSKEKREVIQSVTLALGLIGDCDEDDLDEEIREALIESPDVQADQQSKNYSRIALGQVGANRGSGEFEKGRENIEKALLKSLSRGNNIQRRWSGVALGVLGERLVKNSEIPSAEASRALREQLDDAKNPQDVGAFSIALGILKDQEAKDIVLEKLDRMSDDEARGYAAVSLGLMNAREAVEPIQSIVLQSKYRPELLQQAAIALGLLGDKQLVPDLVDMLADAKGLATQAAISNALGFIGDARSIDPLIAMLDNDELTETARGWAAVALGIVAEKEPLPWNSKIAVDINYRASTLTLNDPNGTGVLNIL